MYVNEKVDFLPLFTIQFRCWFYLCNLIVPRNMYFRIVLAQVGTVQIKMSAVMHPCTHTYIHPCIKRQTYLPYRSNPRTRRKEKKLSTKPNSTYSIFSLNHPLPSLPSPPSLPNLPSPVYPSSCQLSLLLRTLYSALRLQTRQTGTP